MQAWLAVLLAFLSAGARSGHGSMACACRERLKSSDSAGLHRPWLFCKARNSAASFAQIEIRFHLPGASCGGVDLADFEWINGLRGRLQPDGSRIINGDSSSTGIRMMASAA